MNMEKVINGLEVRIISDTDKGYKTIEIPVEEAENILSLLKNRKPKQVNEIAQQISCFSGICQNCGKMLNTTCNKNFCGDCGQAVKWQ